MQFRTLFIAAIFLAFAVSGRRKPNRPESQPAAPEGGVTPPEGAGSGAIVEEIPMFRQFCNQFNIPDCFVVKNVFITDTTFAIDFSPPIPITSVHSEEAQMEGTIEVETFFDTKWGEATVVEMPGNVFVGQVPLANDAVLHLLPCDENDSCTTFGYLLKEADEDDYREDSYWDYSQYDEDMDSYSYYSDYSYYDEEETSNFEENVDSSVEETKSVDPKLRRMLNDVSANCEWARVESSTDYQNLPTQAQLRAFCGDSRGCRERLGINSQDMCDLQDGLISGEGRGGEIKGSEGTASHRNCWIIEKCSFSATFIVPASSWDAFYRSQVSLLVAEFNQAMHNSRIPHRMWLHETVFKQWDTTEYGKTECLDAAQAYNGDMVHCITPNSMGRKPDGSWVYGSAYFPTQGRRKRGVSFSRVDTLPNGSHSSRHTAVHEMGHTLGAQHTKQHNNEKSTMYKGSGSSSRLLKFKNNAQASGKSKVEKNIKKINKYADDIASHHNN